MGEIMKSFSKALRKMAAETTDRDVSRAAEQTADSIDLEEADNERKKRTIRVEGAI